MDGTTMSSRLMVHPPLATCPNPGTWITVYGRTCKVVGPTSWGMCFRLPEMSLDSVDYLDRGRLATWDEVVRAVQRTLNPRDFTHHVCEGRIVHVLHEGRALCGQPGLPREWPPSHFWVNQQECRRATCRICRIYIRGDRP